MRRYHLYGVMILLPALCLLFAAPGCGKKEDNKPGDGAKGDNTGKPGKGKGEEEAAKTELDNKDKWGTLTGTVKYDGEPPTPAKIDMSASKDKDACHDGATEKELVDQTWIVNKENKGVANVAIWLKPPAGKYFKIHPDYLKKAKTEEVLMHQPHCAFLPHVQVYWASKYDKDTEDLIPSGVKFRIHNDAKFNHNTAWAGNPDLNRAGSVTLEPGKDLPRPFKAQDTPITINCDIHKWMNAKVWALDTPYCARTDENGKFTIENVPAGVELYVVSWHEGPGFIDGKGGKKMTLEKENTHDFKVKAK